MFDLFLQQSLAMREEPGLVEWQQNEIVDIQIRLSSERENDGWLIAAK